MHKIFKKIAKKYQNTGLKVIYKVYFKFKQTRYQMPSSKLWLAQTCSLPIFMIEWKGFEFEKYKVPQKSKANRNSS